jgi:hypothetical protein
LTTPASLKKAPKLENPYPCDPTNDDQFCFLTFNTTSYLSAETITVQDYIGTECKCSLSQSEKNGGICGTIIGSLKYKEGLSAMKTVLEASRCHTLDRHNWKAQRDVCGSVDVEEWEEAVSSNFTLDHWPYVNNDNDTRKCIERLSMNSLQNLKKAGAAKLIISFIAVNLYLLS